MHAIETVDRKPSPLGARLAGWDGDWSLRYLGGLGDHARGSRPGRPDRPNTVAGGAADLWLGGLYTPMPATVTSRVRKARARPAMRPMTLNFASSASRRLPRSDRTLSILASSCVRINVISASTLSNRASRSPRATTCSPNSLPSARATPSACVRPTPAVGTLADLEHGFYWVIPRQALVFEPRADLARSGEAVAGATMSVALADDRALYARELHNHVDITQKDLHPAFDVLSDGTSLILDARASVVGPRVAPDSVDYGWSWIVMEPTGETVVAARWEAARWEAARWDTHPMGHPPESQGAQPAGIPLLPLRSGRWRGYDSRPPEFGTHAHPGARRLG